MLENIKKLFTLKYVDNCINKGKYDLALESLNALINEGYKPAETFLKRGQLCHKLLMLDDAYADFSYIINNCTNKYQAYYERMKLNYEINNYYETITDANKLLSLEPLNFEYNRYKFLSYLGTGQVELAANFISNIFDDNKYQIIQFILQETAKIIAEDELAKALRILDVIELIDPDNPIKIFKESTIYGLAGDKNKQNELLKKLDSVFPKYFISHFKFTDMYEERDLLEISFLLELRVFDKLKCFEYPMNILEGYKYQMEGHIIDSKESFERAISINPNKPEAYVLLAQTLQLMSGYDNPAYKSDAEINYKKAMTIYQQENLTAKSEAMKRQIKHLNSNLSFR